MRWCAQDEVNEEDSEQNEVDGMKKAELIPQTAISVGRSQVGGVQFGVRWTSHRPWVALSITAYNSDTRQTATGEVRKA